MVLVRENNKKIKADKNKSKNEAEDQKENIAPKTRNNLKRQLKVEPANKRNNKRRKKKEEETENEEEETEDEEEETEEEEEREEEEEGKEKEEGEEEKKGEEAISIQYKITEGEKHPFFHLDGVYGYTLIKNIIGIRKRQLKKTDVSFIKSLNFLKKNK